MRLAVRRTAVSIEAALVVVCVRQSVPVRKAAVAAVFRFVDLLIILIVPIVGSPSVVVLVVILDNIVVFRRTCIVIVAHARGTIASIIQFVARRTLPPVLLDGQAANVLVGQLLVRTVFVVAKDALRGCGCAEPGSDQRDQAETRQRATDLG